MIIRGWCVVERVLVGHAKEPAGYEKGNRVE